MMGRDEIDFFKEVIDVMPIAFTVKDAASGKILDANPAFLKLLGYTLEEIKQLTWKDLTPPSYLAQSEKLIAKAVRHPKEPMTEEKAYIDKNGHEIPVLLHYCTLVHPGFNRLVLVSFVHDFSTYKNMLDNLRKISFEDTLTGAYNRRFLEKQFAVHLEHDTPVTLILCDVDNLKTVNDTLGHIAGDTLLIEVTKLLKSCTRHADIVARLGGDEFCILLPGTGHPGAQIVIDRLRRAVSAYNEKKHSRDVCLFYSP